MPTPEPALQVVLKLASRCNLNCGYCYVYNKADSSWRGRPPLMSQAVFDAALERTRRHMQRSGQPSVTLTFHGGEPCLIGKRRFDQWCQQARAQLPRRVRLNLQTNGVLLDDEWAMLIKRHQVDVAVSLDGPPRIHDAERVDHRGRGTYDRVLRGLEALRRHDVPLQVLVVIPLGEDGAQVQRHLQQLGLAAVNYLFPDYTHETIAAVRQRFGPAPCADFLIPAFDEWWANGSMDEHVVLFWHVARLVMGGECDPDLFGNRPYGFLFVETDGAIEGLDVLKVCENGMAGIGLNVLEHEFAAVRQASALHRQAIFDGMPPPSGCRGCPEEFTCAGGYLPHRYSAAGFDNPSVWCEDIRRLFAHVRKRLEVSPEETRARRSLLQAAAC